MQTLRSQGIRIIVKFILGVTTAYVHRPYRR